MFLISVRASAMLAALRSADGSFVGRPLFRVHAAGKALTGSNEPLVGACSPGVQCRHESGAGYDPYPAYETPSPYKVRRGNRRIHNPKIFTGGELISAGLLYGYGCLRAIVLRRR